ncbi:hypothetical protein [Flavobacterium sp.]|uniref:hypothetical protein n=1 Tax=Flavobacterium sp. TaxID=239 RepID=UPI0026363D2B|nr:hypothetical protein [Flavobacterium sp.]
MIFEVNDQSLAYAFFRFQRLNFWRVCELRIADLAVHTFCRNKQLVFDKEGLRTIDQLSSQFTEIYDGTNVQIHEIEAVPELQSDEFDKAMILIKELVDAEAKKLGRNAK